jgi:prepilin-type processing-associated H-X9-DG protein
MIVLTVNEAGGRSGIALFRREVAKGMSEATTEMKNANLDASFLLFSMWTESIKSFAADGRGNVIFLDGSAEGMNKTLREMIAMQSLDEGGEG